MFLLTITFFLKFMAWFINKVLLYKNNIEHLIICLLLVLYLYCLCKLDIHFTSFCTLQLFEGVVIFSITGTDSPYISCGIGLVFLLFVLVCCVLPLTAHLQPFEKHKYLLIDLPFFTVFPSIYLKWHVLIYYLFLYFCNYSFH